MSAGPTRRRSVEPAPVAPPGRPNRRFEAIIFDWDGTAVPDRRAPASRLRRLVEDLSAAALDLAVVSGTHVGNVDGQLLARPTGPGRLILCVNRGSEVFEVDGAGPRLIHRRTATPREDRLLTAAAQLTVTRLGVRGVPAKIVSQRLNRRKIDLIPLPAWADPPKARIGELLAAVEERLHRAGIGSLGEAVAIAAAAARDVGLCDARVTSDAKHVEIGLTDKADAARWIFKDLGSRGIGPGLVLIAGDEFGPLGGLPGSDSLMLDPQGARATAVSVGIEPSGVAPHVTWLPGGPEVFLGLLEDQLRRRRDRSVPEIDPDPSWTYTVIGLDRTRERARETLLNLADGRFGTSGAPLDAHPATSPRVLAAGVYVGRGPASELVSSPLWDRLGGSVAHGSKMRRTIDLRSGLQSEEVSIGDAQRRAIRFQSLTRPGTVALRAEGSRHLLSEVRPIVAGRDSARAGVTRGRPWMTVASKPGGVAVAATEVRATENGIDRLERIGAYIADPWRRPSPGAAVIALDEAAAAGFDRLLREQRAAWAQRWSEADVRIAGDPGLEQAVRFALFHLIASVADRGEAAVGARGVSGSAYRGHVFWDSEVFVLPVLAATHPTAARAMLEYRLRRLPVAQEAATKLGREGARFPWESALVGFDVTPRFARDHSGRTVEIQTGLMEEHIVADVAWAARMYLEWSGDREFWTDGGRRLVLETARYWASRISPGEDGRAHIGAVIGPDEYHEAVDDNAFTNVMARWNLRLASRVAGVALAERRRWRELARLLVDGYDRTTGVYEQFAGFHGLEPLIIADIAHRRPVAADLLLGRERVRGAQVVKQADVLMLHHMVPDATAAGSLVPNLEFYEPRTAHGSSLSPGVHAALFARAGRLDEAVALLGVTARLDLDDLTRTTAGGLHLAAMGSLWQALVFGFAGVRARSKGLSLDPHVPESWETLEVPVSYRGNRIRLRMGADALRIEAERPLVIRLPGAPPMHVAGPLRCRRSGGIWKEVRG